MRVPLLVTAWIIVGSPSAVGQQHKDSAKAGVGMKMGDVSGMDMGGWRMPPMRLPMPMIPGLDGETPPVTPFLPRSDVADPSTLPLAVPNRVLRLGDGDTTEIRAMLVRRVIRGRTFVMYGYNAQYPGPLIRVPQDATIYVRFINEIDAPSTIHWHGVRIDNHYDGVPGVTQAAVQPGDTFFYKVHFPDAGIYWYHPHVREDIQQDLGLAGNMLVDPTEMAYYSPVNEEKALILDDLLIDDKGLIPWGKEAPTHSLMGRFGNVLMVNGEPDYELTVHRGEVVRFYLTNVSNTRVFNFAFPNTRMKVVASDVGRYEKEAWVKSIPIAPAERYVIEVKFDSMGELALLNRIQAIDHYKGVFVPRTDTLGRVTVIDPPTPDDYGRTFDTLRENEAVEADIDKYRKDFDRPPDHRLRLTVELGDLPVPILQMIAVDTFYRAPVEWNETMPMMNWISSGKTVRWILQDEDTGKENQDIDWVFHVGDVVKIRLFNDPLSLHPMQHPIHLHGQRFLILDVNGVRNPDLVWKDTVVVPTGATVDILVDMSNPGDWMMHCHIAEHLASGMMTVVHVLP